MLRITDPVEIARFEAMAKGARKAPGSPVAESGATQGRGNARSPHSGKRGRRVDPIRVDDRLQIPEHEIICAVLRLTLSPAPKFRSKLEARYAQHLELRRAAGEVGRWWYEPVTFRLPGGHWYTPDFVLEIPDGRLEWHETKGYLWKQDSLKIDAFREIWPGLAYFLVHAAGRGFSLEKR